MGHGVLGLVSVVAVGLGILGRHGGAVDEYCSACSNWSSLHIILADRKVLDDSVGSVSGVSTGE